MAVSGIFSIRGIPHFHYEIFVTIKQQDGKSREIRKRFWLADDREAEDKQRELKHQAPVNALTWTDAHAHWLADPDNNYSDGHIATSRKTIELWTKDFGADSTIEGTEKTLRRFFTEFGKEFSDNLRYVCSDMWKPYLKVIAECAVNALNILDRFHIMMHMSKAIDEVRRDETRRLRENKRDVVLSKSRWCFLKRPENLTSKQEVRLAELLAMNLRTVRAYLLT